MTQYEDEFEEVVGITEFFTWLLENLKNFSYNITNSHTFNFQKRPIHEWVSMFLGWCEYTDYIEESKR